MLKFHLQIIGISTVNGHDSLKIYTVALVHAKFLAFISVTNI